MRTVSKYVTDKLNHEIKGTLMEQYVIDQIKWGAKYLPINLVKYAFISKSSEETRRLREKGFICGVCHPTDNYEQINNANIEWVRFDIPYPYDESGNVSQSFIRFKEECREYSENGLKIMAITPYPYRYLENGIKLDTLEGENKVREIARFMLEELKPYIGAFQITNEMGMPRFTIPLTMDQAARFIGIQLEELYPIRENLLIGYNSAGPQADLHYKLKPFHKYCDYVGIDMYMGSFVFGTMWMHDALLNYLWSFTRKPILIQEFGYIGEGAPKSRKEKRNILRSYGASSERDAKANIEKFVGNFPPRMKEYVEHICDNNPKRYGKMIFNSEFVNHFYRELPKLTLIPGYPHTPVGQAKFFDHAIKRFYNKDFVAGMFIYSYTDSEKCYVCGQSDCPVETRWGLVDNAGKPKPAYYAVKKVFGDILGK